MSLLSCQGRTHKTDNSRGDGVRAGNGGREWRKKGKKVVVERRGAAKRQLIIPKPKTSRAHTSAQIKYAAALCNHILYTTFVCELRLCHCVLLIYGTLQVPWRRCRALQFMSNLVNILSPVRPVSHCFPLFSVFSVPRLPPRLSSVPPLRIRALSDRQE